MQRIANTAIEIEQRTIALFRRSEDSGDRFFQAFFDARRDSASSRPFASDRKTGNPNSFKHIYHIRQPSSETSHLQATILIFGGILRVWGER